MIIDFHTHCFPDALAPKALSWLSDKASSKPVTDGTVKGSSALLKESGVDFGVVCSIATNPRQLPKVNGFAIDINDLCRNLIALGSAHPDCEELEDELQRLLDHDIRGIKVHPEYASYYIDAPEWDRVFSLCEEMGIFVVTHAGFDFISPDRVAAPPERIAKVLDRHKNLTLICAHLGGNRYWEQVKTLLCGRENLYLDTAMLAKVGIDPDLMRSVIITHGTDKVLFGSDMPWSYPKDEIALIRTLGLSAEDENKIFSENAKKLLF